jgi:hypothetical protein
LTDGQLPHLRVCKYRPLNPEECVFTAVTLETIGVPAEKTMRQTDKKPPAPSSADGSILANKEF